MSITKKLSNITKKQINDKGVQALANRPNATSQYGVGGLSPTQLKLWFDKLATFLSEKINELQNTLSSDEAAAYIRLLLDEYSVSNLDDLVQSFKNGAFAEKILHVFPSANSFVSVPLQTVIHDIAQAMSESNEATEEEIEALWESMSFLTDVRQRLYVLQEAPPIEALSDAMLLCPPTLAQLASMT